MAFAFSCTACGKCCKGGGPVLSIEEVFKYQDVFISGLRWTAHYIQHKHFTPHPAGGELVPTMWLKEHYSEFLSSFTTEGHTRYPVIYPYVTGYTLARGMGCSALNADGACSLHADKPDMCRSVPFDPMLPEALQAPTIARFKQFGCMTETDDTCADNVIFDDGRITDAEYKAHYQKRLDAMKRDTEALRQLVFLLGDADQPGRIGLPSRNHFMEITERGEWMETSMAPLLVFYRRLQLTAPRVHEFITAQERLITAGIENAIRQRQKSHRARTNMMRRYLDSYSDLREALPKTLPTEQHASGQTQLADSTS
jgi:Fe-S-cluster containining protein